MLALSLPRFMLFRGPEMPQVDSDFCIFLSLVFVDKENKGSDSQAWPYEDRVFAVTSGLNLILGRVDSDLYFYFSPVSEEDSSK